MQQLYRSTFTYVKAIQMQRKHFKINSCKNNPYGYFRKPTLNWMNNDILQFEISSSLNSRTPTATQCILLSLAMVVFHHPSSISHYQYHLLGKTTTIKVELISKENTKPSSPKHYIEGFGLKLGRGHLSF